jgi:hypothetical protein
MTTAKGVRIRHKEYVTAFQSSTAFSVALYPINPGRSTSFPWLSTIASGFESYKFHKLVYHICSSQSTESAGRTYAYIDFDVVDPQPLSQAVLMANANAVSGNLWIPDLALECPVKELHRRQNSYYVSATSGGAPLQAAAGLYDAGNFWIATAGDASPGGMEIYVEYDVEFITPSYSYLGQTTSYTTPVGSNPVANKDFLNSSVPRGNAPVQMSSTEESPGGAVNHTVTFLKSGRYLVSLTVAALINAAGFTGGAPTTTGTMLSVISNFIYCTTTSSCTPSMVAELIVTAGQSLTWQWLTNTSFQGIALEVGQIAQ